MNPLVTLKDVSVTLGGKSCLDKISFDILPAEIITLIGPNGAGKTTLVNTLLGLQQPTGGTITRQAGLRFGYMPQKLSIDPTLPLTALRFLSLAHTDADTCKNAMALTGIPQLGLSPIQSLSGGELQRLLLARAILRRPDLLVLDEPVQGVDVMGQEALYQLIGQLRTELNCAILMVSHDLHLVMGATDRVICLNQHICCSGSPDSVSSDPAYTSLFGTRSALYNHHHDHQHNMHGDVLNPRKEKEEGGHA